MKLQVVSSDAATVQVNYMGEIQTIPSNVIRLEAGAPTQQKVTASATASTTARPPPPAQSSRQQPAGAPEGNWNTYNLSIQDCELVRLCMLWTNRGRRAM